MDLSNNKNNNRKKNLSSKENHPQNLSMVITFPPSPLQHLKEQDSLCSSFLPDGHFLLYYRSKPLLRVDRANTKEAIVWLTYPGGHDFSFVYQWVVSVLILFPGKQWSWFPSVLSPPWEQNQEFLFHLSLSSIFLPGKQWSWFPSLFLPPWEQNQMFLFFTCLCHLSFSLVNDGAGFHLYKCDVSF